MKFREILAELQRRNVFKALLAYLAVAWVVIQIASILLPAFNAPEYAMKVLLVVLGIGFFFWAVFSWIYDLTPNGFQKTDATLTNIDTYRRNSKRLNSVIASSIVIAILLLLIASFWAGSQWNQPQTQGEKRIAVIPFEQLDENKEDSYFSEGMTETLINALSKVGDVKVLSMASTRYLQAGFSPADPIIANELSYIDYFIYGTIQRNSNSISVVLKISKTITGNVIWEKEYTSDISMVRQLWTSIAMEVTNEFDIKNKDVQLLQKAGITSVKPETYELYLKGKYYLNKSTVADWQRGIVYLEEAVDQNAADPYAYAGLAEGYVTLGHSLTPPPDVFPKALAAAKRAIQLDSSNAEGWAALSHYHTYFGWDWDLAEYAFEKANEINPNMAYNHYHRAWYLALFGRMDEAILEHKLAQELDPFISLHTAWLGGLYRMAGAYDKGLIEAEKASGMQHDNALSMYIKGSIYIDTGRTEEGLETLAQAAKINPGWRYLGYGTALFKTGRFEEGMKIIHELEAMEETPFYSLCLAYLYFNADDLDKGFEWLQSAKGHAFYPWIRVIMPNPKVKKDPRYLELLKELGLPPPSPLVYNST